MREFVEKHYPKFKYNSHKENDESIELTIEAAFDYSFCPNCNMISKSIHVFTKRSFIDIPINKKTLKVNTFTRVFKCVNHECATKTFTESLDFINKDDKVSKRLLDKILEVGSIHSNRKSVEILKEDNIIVSRGLVQRLTSKYKSKGENIMGNVIELNKPKTTIGVMNGEIDYINTIQPSILDNILETIEDNYNIINIVNEVFPDKTSHIDSLKPAIFILASISARLKQLSATSSVPLALTSVKIIEKLKLNLLERNGDGSYFSEGWLRNFILSFEETKLIIDCFNVLFYEIINRLNKRPKLHILDCTKIEVNLSNTNYENSSIALDKDNNRMRGYKVGVLRGCLPVGGIIEEICIDSANVHDLALTKEMLLNSKHLKKGDTLIADRGFIDLDLILALKERGINVIIPARNNMDIFTEAVSIAKESNKWEAHPERKEQQISLVKNLDNWKKKEKSIELSASVVRIPKSYNFEYSDTEDLSQDNEYMYIVILSTNNELSARSIILTYSKRPEIEEDFRQLKEYWKLTDFKSTKYKFLVFYIMTMFSAYNFYQLYKNLDSGKKYKRTTLPVAVKQERNRFKPSEIKVIIVSGKYFAIYEFYETFELYDKFPEEIRTKFKNYIKDG